MATLNVRIPDDLRRQLEEISRQSNRPTSDLVRESLRRYLAVERLKMLRRLSVPLAEAQGYITDEDIFRDVS